MIKRIKSGENPEDILSQTDMMLNNEYSGASSYLQQTQQPFQKEIGVQ